MTRPRLKVLFPALLAVYVLLWLLFHDRPAPFVEWDIPTDPFEKQAYDFAHSIKLPDGVPKPVPFKFCKLEVLGLCLGKATSEEYFDHLCKTESGEYVFKIAKEVEGLYLMRPRRSGELGGRLRLLESPTALEDPTDEYVGALAQMASLMELDISHFGLHFIQPPLGHYHFLDVHLTGKDSGITKVTRIYRNTDTALHQRKDFYPELKKWYPHIVAWRLIDKSEAQYGITWRGVRRLRDREFGIAGGEVIVFDRTNNAVMAIRRVFARNQATIARRPPNGFYWETAISCPRIDKKPHTTSFIPEVLIPVEDNIKGDDHE